MLSQNDEFANWGFDGGFSPTFTGLSQGFYRALTSFQSVAPGLTVHGHERTWAALVTGEKTSDSFHTRFTDPGSQGFHRAFRGVSQKLLRAFTTLLQGFHKAFTALSDRFHTPFTEFSHDFHRVYCLTRVLNKTQRRYVYKQRY